MSPKASREPSPTPKGAPIQYGPKVLPVPKTPPMERSESYARPPPFPGQEAGGDLMPENHYQNAYPRLSSPPPPRVKILNVVDAAQRLVTRLRPAPSGGTPGQGSEASNEPSPEKESDTQDERDARVIEELIEALQAARNDRSKTERDLSNIKAARQGDLRSTAAQREALRKNFSETEAKLIMEKEAHEFLVRQWIMTNQDNAQLRSTVEWQASSIEDLRSELAHVKNISSEQTSKIQCLESEIAEMQDTTAKLLRKDRKDRSQSPSQLNKTALSHSCLFPIVVAQVS